MKRKHNRRNPGGPFLERLEDRLLLSFGPLAVSPAWFEDLTSGSPSGEQVSAGPPATASIQSVDWQGQTLDVLADTWIVQFDSDSLAGIASVGQTRSLLSVGDVGFDVMRGLGMEGSVLIRTHGADFQTVSDWLAGDADVEYFEPDAAVQVDRLPDDPSFGSLWGLNNTGQTGGTADADIDAPEAWDLTTGSRDVVVAVIDTGIDYTHADLAANVWTNPGEIAGDGIDNDANGYADDVHGWDFAYGDSNPMDGNGHGTHVSGTIGAAGDNGVGIAGVNWNVSLMAVKFLDDTGRGTTAGAVLAVNYVTMMKQDGVNVVASNNSWGGGGFSSALRDAIAAAGQQDVLFVAAAGNGGSDGLGDNNDTAPFYPASYDLDNVLSVAATDSRDRRASFSNYGPTTVDLGAPGVAIYSTLPGNSYGAFSGTSMATPHVTGAAALLAAADGGASGAEIKAALLAGADPISSLAGLTVSGGRLNVDRAIQLLLGGIPPAASPYGEVRGLVWSDLNNDGVRDADEPGVAGWTAYADLDASGALAPLAAHAVASADVPLAIADVSTVASDLTVSGLVGALYDLNVTLNISHTYDSDLTVTLISPAGTRVELFNRVGGPGNDFSGTTLDDEAAFSIVLAAAPFAGTYQPTGLLSALDGESANGTWSLEIVDGVLLDTGTLNSWSLSLTTGEPSAPTDADGRYVLADLPVGAYAVRVAPPAGWLATNPPAASHAVDLAGGVVIEDLDFGFVPPAAIAGRYVFYNHSSFDGNNPAANLADDGAIAPSPSGASDPAWGKQALMPGEAASFLNYTSYSRGINGIIVDIAVLREPGSLSAADFTFLTGNTSDLADWVAAPAPQVVDVRPAPGAAHTYRVTLIWADSAIANTWLRVEVGATARTGLAAPDVFYFGNAIGDTGDSTTIASVDSGDRLGARAHPRGAFDPAPIDFPYDFNRDGLVDSGDRLIARVNATSAFTALKLIDTGGVAPPAGAVAAPLRASDEQPASLLPAPAPIESDAADFPIAATTPLPQRDFGPLADLPDSARVRDDIWPSAGALPSAPAVADRDLLDALAGEPLELPLGR